jgi:ribosomal-protein-alanine N-acetyltransferase
MAEYRMETERLVLRLPEKGDYESFVEGYRACREAQNRFDEGRISTAFMTRRWFELLVDARRQEADADLAYLLHAFRRSDGLAVGHGDVTTLARAEFQAARLGYAVHNPYWGRGLGTELARALVQFALENRKYHRVEANIDPENRASRRVAEKAGLAFEGVRKAYFYDGAVWRDQEIYACTNPALSGPAEEFAD